MNVRISTSAESRRERRRRRHRDRIRAVLAGSLVLAIGAGSTLAAWADSVAVTGDFGTNEFNVQGSVDGGSTWQEMSTLPGGTLAFPVGALGLVPGDTVYAPIMLRVDPTKADYDAAITLNGASITGGVASLATELRYGAKRSIAPANCSAVGYAGNGTALVALNTILTTGSGATSFDLGKDGTPVGVCMAVSLPLAAAIGAQGDSISASWTFTAASK